MTAEDVPGEEDLAQTDDAAKAVDKDPEDHVNRPEQPGYDPSEKKQYDDPTLEIPIADRDKPEDR